MRADDLIFLAIGAIVTAALTALVARLAGRRLAARPRAAVTVSASAVPVVIVIGAVVQAIRIVAPPDSDMPAMAFTGLVILAVYAFCVSYPVALLMVPGSRWRRG